jgi:Caspase domain
MKRLALLIGSEVGGLRGCDSDVALLADTLGGMGFQSRPLTGRAATRAGIIGAYRDLIEEAAEGDAVVVTYSGHGGRQRNKSQESGPAFWHYIVPTDINETTGGDFRGLLTEELRLLQLKLTMRTANVTTILDCCHSGRMSRRIGLIPRFWRGTWPAESIAARWSAADAGLREQVAAAGLGPEWLESNPRAVRVVACRTDESAYELELDPGKVNGVLTASLVEILRSLPSRVTWDELDPRLRRVVSERAPDQHPGVEGQAGSRFLFSLEEGQPDEAYPVVVSGESLELDGARFFGFEEGDTFLLRRAGEGAESPGLHAVVSGEPADRAVLRLEPPADRASLGRDVLAYPLRRSLGRRPVVIEPVGHPLHQDVVRVLMEEGQVWPVDKSALSIATVHLDGDGILLLDAEGSPLWTRARPANARTFGQLKQALATLASAANLRELAPADGERLETQVSMEVSDADGTVLEAGALVTGDHLNVSIRNNGAPSANVYVNLFDIGLAGSIASLSSAVDGVPVAGQETYRVADGAGIKLYWPDAENSPDPVPRDEPRPESYVAIVSDRAQDLRRLNTRRVRDVAAPTSTLQSLLDSVRSGVRDSRPNVSLQPVHFNVLRFDFLLDPGFLIDETRDLAKAYGKGDGATAPAEASIVLHDLVVSKTRPVFRTNVRVDALFTSGGDLGNGQPWRAWTRTFPRIGRGDHLPIESLLLYDGPVHRFLDVALWVSRDDGHAPSLGELIGTTLSIPSVGGAIATLMTLAGAAAIAGPVGAGVAAVGILVAAAGRVIRAATPRSIGLYCTTLLPDEGFDRGRRPASGVTTAQGFGFAYEVRTGR